jgi:hypothetical protein
MEPGGWRATDRPYAVTLPHWEDDRNSRTYVDVLEAANAKPVDPLQENEENAFLPAAYRRSNLSQAANIKLVCARQVQVHGLLAQKGANRPVPAGSAFSVGPGTTPQEA